MSEYTAIVKQAGQWWIGWIEELPGVNCQERTREDLIETLRGTLREAVEFNRAEARDAAGKDYEEEHIHLPVPVNRNLVCRLGDMLDSPPDHE